MGRRRGLRQLHPALLGQEASEASLRVAFVVYGGLHLVSGGFIYDRLLVERLRAVGVEVEVVPLPWPRYARALAENLASLPPALDRCDLVLQDELIHPAVFWRNRRLRRARVPVVALVHNLASRQPATRLRPLVRAIERRYLEGVDGVVAVCESTRRDVEALLARRTPSVVARAGRDHVSTVVDEALVVARSRAPGPLQILFAGVLMPHKGLHRLVAALGGSKNHGIHIHAAGALDGDPAHVASLRRQIAGLGLGDRVTLYGQLQGEALWQLFRRSHVLALPSDREAYPLVCIEALASGLAVLVTDRGGSSELITEGREGHCLPPDDVAAWAAALTRLAENREELARMGLQALGRHRRLGTWTDTAVAVRSFCEKVLAAATAR